jgi:hypothetical protein
LHLCKLWVAICLLGSGGCRRYRVPLAHALLEDRTASQFVGDEAGCGHSSGRVVRVGQLS